MHLKSRRRPLLLISCLASAGASRPFDGTYTVVNKANGRRMFASLESGLFIVDDGGPIYNDQMWLFAPQENQSVAIVNAANGLRVFAQSGADGANGFSAIGDGPIFQDQRWLLSPQSDGSYSIVNVKSGRRILAEVNQNSAKRFVAVSSSESVRAEETWWLINQERDETAQYLAEVELERSRLAALAEETVAAQNASTRLVEDLQMQLQSLRSLKEEATASSTQLKEVQSMKSKLLADIQKQTDEMERLRSELSVAKTSEQRLLSHARSLGQEREQQQSDLSNARREQKRLLKELEVGHSENNLLDRKVQDISKERERLIDVVAAMDDQLRNATARLDASSVELTAQPEIFSALPTWFRVAFTRDMSMRIALTILAIAAVAAIAACGKSHCGLRSEVKGKQKRIDKLEQDLHAEIGDMVRVGDFDGDLGTDFGFRVFNTEINQEAVRLIKMQCPGVKHADVEVELVFNGCEVTIRRPASRGVARTVWKKRFQFKPSDGLFEFREEQMMLEDGFLQLVFRSCAFHNRLVLFPRHFSLTDTDGDACWEYSADGEVEHDEAEAWWHDAPEIPAKTASAGVAAKMCSGTDVDTESTASTARVLV